jgi:hypothetical protein
MVAYVSIYFSFLPENLVRNGLSEAIFSWNDAFAARFSPIFGDTACLTSGAMLVIVPLFGSGSTAFPAGSNQAQDGWNEGNDDNGINDTCQVFTYEGYVTEKVTGIQEKAHPEDTTESVEKHEFPVAHAADAGGEGYEGTDDRHEPTDDDGRSAPLIIELLGLNQVVLVEEFSLVFAEGLGSDEFPDMIIDDIAGYGRRHE